MTKSIPTSKKPRKPHTPEFREEVLTFAERIGVAAAARQLSLYESQIYNWRSKQQSRATSSERESGQTAEIVTTTLTLTEAVLRWKQNILNESDQVEGRKSIFSFYRIRIVHTIRDYTSETRDDATV